MNAMFCNANGERRYLVNVQKCPVYTESLEQQIWAANGEPDKSADNDYPNDAGGYFIVKDYPGSLWPSRAMAVQQHSGCL